MQTREISKNVTDAQILNFIVPQAILETAINHVKRLKEKKKCQRQH